MTSTSTSAARRPARRSPLLLLALLVGLLATGCGASPAPSSKAGPSTTTRRDRGEVARPAQVVRTDRPLVAYAQPDAGADRQELAATTTLGSPTALLVTGYRAGWVEVLVPGRPTGRTAWLPAQGLDVRAVTTSIRVDLAAHTLTLLDGGREVLSTEVAVGAPDTPTPTGRFSITDKLDTQDSDGPYGRYAIGLSGRSEVLTEFGGGDGQIGIHGTDHPELIGHDVSHGCIRVPNAVMEQLNGLLPLGTPVVVG